MPNFSKESIDNLNTAHPILKELFEEVVKYFDCKVLCGHRGKEEQDKAFTEGKSKLKFPKSKHNSNPSLAVDVYPYPIDFKDIKRFYMFIGFVKGIATSKGIKIRTGGDWDGDTQVKDETFIDLPHFELIL